jgi:spore maturation protein CgeB
MRWLILGPGHADSFAENIAATLIAMGHQALLMPRGSRSGLIGRFAGQAHLLAARAGLKWSSAEERWGVAAARRWRPDVVLAPTVQLSEAGLAAIRRAGGAALVAWWGDPPANLRGMGLAVHGWDLILLKDRAAVGKLRTVGLNAHLMHEAMNPAWHRPLAVQRNSEIAVVGNWYGYRQSLASAMLARGMKLAMYGPAPPRWSLPEIRRGHRRRYVVKEEKSLVFGEALGCLNSFSLSEGDSLNCRAFEIAGAGGLQLIEHRPVLEECFEPGKEVLPFRSMEELEDLVRRAEQEPLVARRVREAGARRALAHHTYRHRIEAILGMLDLRTGGAP